MEMIIYNNEMIMHNDDTNKDDDEDIEVDNLYNLLDVLNEHEQQQQEDDNNDILLHLNKYLTPEQINDFKKELKSGRLYK
eukprot:CAMPEP_0185918120 /NCGR_PEP_ID=MMETSP0924C-20121207/5365_1 /TAXON_ID=321610 /ORGANISM="Perkinsus chesapeaki, Strain ATCC PRA-65" /LENGTH=79 /DNA_ID=CAMNT_0028645349 /DNA_START=1 /DNA_END=237 /DNA_ORIENTATION=-